MSSFAGAYTHRYFTGYTAGKGALEQIVRNAADEYGILGVRFNAVRPGFITTEIMEGISREGSTYASYIANTPLVAWAIPTRSPTSSASCSAPSRSG